MSRSTRILLPLLALFAGTLLMLPSCSTTYERRNPTGETFPTVTGQSLAGKTAELPTIGHGAPLLLLIGYDQDTQFDLDRWLLALDAAGVQVRLFEVPTLPGMIPRMISGTIDNGMRRGIPEEDWGLVITVYGDAHKIAKFTGNADSLPGRIVLLDADGKVAFFHDRGYSLGTLKKLQAALAALLSGPQDPRASPTRNGGR